MTTKRTTYGQAVIRRRQHDFDKTKFTVPPARRSSKCGAALVIVLGFLAILTILIIAFSAQSRTERLAGRAYLSTAQTRQLLNTALTRALEDIENTVGTNYPSFFVKGSPLTRGNDPYLVSTLDFSIEKDYFPIGNTSIAAEFDSALSSARWQTLPDSGSNTVGRIGYIIINTSGLLDANHVGGSHTNPSPEVVERRSGVSPSEVQLTSEILDELSESSAPLFASDGTVITTGEAGLAFTYNRANAWRRFETLRDVMTLNKRDEPYVIDSPIASFSTFSFDPREDARTFMGTNWTTVTDNKEFIRAELAETGIANPDFVLNQLRDYLDTDTIPEDEHDEYTDESVEPVPLINELALTCNFMFSPQIEETGEDDEGNVIFEVTSVIISNSYELELEIWYPFIGYETENTFTILIDDPEAMAEGVDFPEELFGAATNWADINLLPTDITTPGLDPYDYLVYGGQYETEVSNTNEIETLFENMRTDIQFPLIYCEEDSGAMVDRVINLSLPLQTAVENELFPAARELYTNLFNAATAVDESIGISLSMSCVDPRLNWEGQSTNQWKEDIVVGENSSAGSIGGYNDVVIAEFITTPDDTDKIVVRNIDRIDTPWEFTYFLYDVNKPWKTFQMLEEYDDDDTRFILRNLSPYPHGPPTAGRINPYSPHPDIIASTFMNLPLDGYNVPPVRQLTSSQASAAATAFIEYFDRNDWPTHAANYGTDIYKEVITDLNTWEQEAFFRNSYELFNPRDTLYTILLAAQNGTDINNDGVISDDEVRSTQKAVVYVWRDPETEQAACVFYGLSDTLQSSIGSGDTWKEILQNFAPNP
ncbi:MAG: hypothetical protein V3V05_04490 [Pontiella sp.]